MTFSRSVLFDVASDIVAEAIDRGVNFIDTAERHGDSEEFLGKIPER
jgi:aryl-alcohol dehydrogenase-like predicted oxidoreductase